MTFAEYNTDDNFKGNSTADELVKIGFDEGKTREDIENSLSPLWKEDKKGNVKKALDKYYKVETPKEEETKPTEEKVLEKVVEQTGTKPMEETPKSTSNLKGSVKKYADKESNIADEAQRVMDEEIKGNVSKNWRELMDSETRRAEGYKRIDDHMIEQLPTFIFRRYQNGEFGDISDTSTPEGKQSKKNAQLRLAHFMINELGTKLSNMSHIIRKDGEQEESDYETYQKSNLEQGMQNRWAKYKADTDGAIKAVEKEFGNEQNARLAAEQFTRDRKANLYWNMMDQDQKIYAMEVSKAIGDMLGGMDVKELASFIAGSALNGNLTKDELIGVGIAQLVSKSPELMEKYPDAKNFISSMFGSGVVSDLTGGIGGTKTDSNGNETNLTGNLKNYKTIGGEEISFDFSDSNAGKKIQAVYDDLIDRYKKGEIDEATFKEYYDPMYSESKKHPGSFKTFFSSGSDEAIRKANTAVRVDVSEQLDALNTQAKNGEIKPSDYNEKFKALKEKAQKYGASEKDLKSIDKGKVSDEKILKAAEKKSKKK